jgi:hypothetical protein
LLNPNLNQNQSKMKKVSTIFSVLLISGALGFAQPANAQEDTRRTETTTRSTDREVTRDEDDREARGEDKDRDYGWIGLLGLAGLAGLLKKPEKRVIYTEGGTRGGTHGGTTGGTHGTTGTGSSTIR